MSMLASTSNAVAIERLFRLTDSNFCIAILFAFNGVRPRFLVTETLSSIIARGLRSGSRPYLSDSVMALFASDEVVSQCSTLFGRSVGLFVPIAPR